MDVKQLTDILKSLILRDGRVALPYMGAIESKDIPASFSEGGSIIAPPSKELVFNNFDIYGNDAIANEYSKIAGVSVKSAKDELAEVITDLKRRLIDDKSLQLEGLGTLEYTAGNDFKFVADPGFIFYTDSYGLNEVKIEEKAPQLTNQANKTGSKAVQTASNKTNKVWMWVVACIVVFILLCILIYIFRDALQPLLEKVLYSSEERSVIHYATH